METEWLEVGPEEKAHKHLDEFHGKPKYLPPPERSDNTPVEELAYLHRTGQCTHIKDLRAFYDNS